MFGGAIEGRSNFVMANQYADRIIKHIADGRYLPQKVEKLADDLAIADSERHTFRRAVKGMIRDGQVVLELADRIALRPPGRQMTGVFQLSRRGFGFVTPESPTQYGDLFVPERHTQGALTGDRVRANVIRSEGRLRRDRSPYIGNVVEILQRAQKQFVGNLSRRGTLWVVHVDGHGLRDPVVIRDPQAKDAHVGDKVVLDLIVYPTEDEPGEGVITEVLGKQGDVEVETKAVMRARGLPDRFPEEVLDEARAVTQTFDGVIATDRKDLTGQLVCTIDPPDAKDFDDAISLEKFDPAKGETVYELGVHIADVSHFVKRNSVLDEEARSRGNSAYLPRKVVPMLPEVLSNGVCSLQEGVNRFCKSLTIQYDADGQVVGHRLANTVIRSSKRFTYLEAQALIDGDPEAAREHTRGTSAYDPRQIQLLKWMNELACLVHQRRLQQGMIVLDLPDAQLAFGDDGGVIDVVPEDDAFTHTIIEMFMVEANEQVAQIFAALDVPMVRRIHADPPSHDLRELQGFARVAGYNIPDHPSREQLQALLAAVRNKPSQHAVHLAVLQTLSRAEYAPALTGHFALASDHYTHFTSPIRRYPDLVVHRALDVYLDHSSVSKRGGGRNKKGVADALRDDSRSLSELDLVELGRHCSKSERNAEAAERDLTKFFVLALLSDYLGHDFNGTVTGVTGSGVFVQLDRYLVDGFIHVNDLPSGAGTATARHPENWRFNRHTGALVAQRSGKTVSIGSRLTVRIVKVNPAGRQLDLAIIDGRSRSSSRKLTQKPQRRKQRAGAKKAHQATIKLKRSKSRR